MYAEACEWQEEGPRRNNWEDGLPALNRNAEGIDVSNPEHYVAVPKGNEFPSVRNLGSFTADPQRMAYWLKTCGSETVVMQAMGVYWVALYQILENYDSKST